MNYSKSKEIYGSLNIQLAINHWIFPKKTEISTTVCFTSKNLRQVELGISMYQIYWFRISNMAIKFSAELEISTKKIFASSLYSAHFGTRQVLVQSLPEVMVGCSSFTHILLIPVTNLQGDNHHGLMKFWPSFLSFGKVPAFMWGGGFHLRKKGIFQETTVAADVYCI